MAEHTRVHTLGWTAGERRGGTERRVAVMERADERRDGERRNGPGEPAAQQDPIATLAEPKRGLAAFGARLVPPHEVHDAIPSLAAIAGHPIHPMLVPLPIGAFIGAIVADVAFAATGDRFFGRAGRFLTGAGLATGVLASAPGGVDFLGRPQVRAHPASWLHAGGNAAALALAAASLAFRARAGDDAKAVHPVALALSASAGAVLVVTGWLGGELSYRHRIGVIKQDGTTA